MEADLSNKPDASVDRIAPRYVFEGRIRIRVHRAEQAFVVEAWMRDISESGLGAFVARELILGEHVTLEIPFAGSSKLAIPAKVARRLGTQYGFQFTALSAEQRDKIISAVNGQPEITWPRPR